ncbi:MAG: ribonuclease PH [Deltaproteobacteria bacterium]|nr:ribonuclease PH [Deltaproteobacteria bacterium]
MRSGGRGPLEVRPVRIEKAVLKYAEGSALIRMGDTQVLCAASVKDEVPGFREAAGAGWVTAEYSLLPRSTRERVDREAAKGRIKGRTHEIQRMIGRSLRAAVDLEAMGPMTVQIDCDVLQADGGTRTAAVTGAFVALYQAFETIRGQGRLDASPIRESVAAVSAGIVGGEILLDLDYDEDRKAQVDLNLVMTSAGRFVEIQGAAEGAPFDHGQLKDLLNAAETGIRRLLDVQKAVLEL